MTGAWDATAQALKVSFLSVLLACTPGCSFVFTRGPSVSSSALPQPESPECTASNAAPIADTVFAVTLLTLTAVSIVYAAQPCPHPPRTVDGVCYNELAYFPAGGAALLGALFIPSAVVGYSRTSACRASLASRPAPRVSTLPQPRASLLLSSPVEGCNSTGDAPLLCRSITSWPGEESGLSASDGDRL